MTRVRVKMCGTTRQEDADAGVALGVDALGFILYPPSPRYIAPAAIEKIIGGLPPFVDRVGVFVDVAVAEVEKVAAVGLSCLQLHGKESPEYCQRLRERLPHLRLIKAFRVGEQSRAEDFLPYRQCVDAFLLDTYVKGEPGGTGKSFAWELLNRLQLTAPVILAGGLTVGNVEAAVRRVNPFAIDINSGVESSPGIKDHALLAELMGRLSRLQRQS